MFTYLPSLVNLYVPPFFFKGQNSLIKTEKTRKIVKPNSTEWMWMWMAECKLLNDKSITNYTFRPTALLDNCHNSSFCASYLSRPCLLFALWTYEIVYPIWFLVLAVSIIINRQLSTSRKMVNKYFPSPQNKTYLL